MSALDPFDYCPCGSGKKVKFCCSKELAAELGKIERMIEGDQRLAALQETERQLTKHRGNAALMNYRAILRLSSLDDPASLPAIEEFVTAHPELPGPYVYRALARLPGDLPGALDDLQQALARVQPIHERDPEAPPPDGLSQALEAVIMELVRSGSYLSAIALLRAFPARDEQGRIVQNPTLIELQRSLEIPLLYKESLAPPPANQLGDAWSEELLGALGSAQGGAWLAGLQTLEKLAAQHPSPLLRKYIGLFNAYLLRTVDAVASLRQFAGLSGVDPDDAVEAEALAQLLDPAAAKDVIEQVTLTYTVTDPSALMERLLSDKRAESVPFHPGMTPDGEPPPKGIFQVLDRALPASGVGLAREAVPSFLGTAILFGRETDRDARLEFTTLRTDDFSAKIAQLRIMAGDFLAGQAVESVEERVPINHVLRVARWRFPADTPPALTRKLQQDYEREHFAPRWMNTKLAVLGGRSPREAAADPTTRLKASAAVLRVELERAYERETSFDFNIIRGQLGLPPAGPIELKEDEVYFVPLARLRRVAFAKLGDEDLWAFTTRAFASGLFFLAGQSAQEMTRRESLMKTHAPAAYRILVSVTPADTPEALDHLHKYRASELAAGGSGVESLFLEIQLRRARREPEQLLQTLDTIRRKHVREPGVGQRLAQVLVQLGLIHPDGTPVGGPPMAAAPGPEQAVAAAASAEAGKLWTPDGAAAGEEKPKLWMPGMD